jgi:hypothetical protein
MSPDHELDTLRRSHDELQLAHEAATAELTARRERLKSAEAHRRSNPTAYREALDAARLQRDRVVTLVDQIRQAGALLTLAETKLKTLRRAKDTEVRER